MAEFKNTTIDDTGAITLPKGTTAQRPSAGNGRTRYNTDTNTIEYYDESKSDWVSGVSSAAFATSYPNTYIQAEGGKITQVDGYTIHTFEHDGTFKVISGEGSVDYLIVGGGGGGGGGGPGSGPRGGGGAGGFIEGFGQSVTVGNYPVVVGGPGGGGNEGSTGSEVSGTNGGNSSIFSLTAIGGGFGPGYFGGNTGGSGGSGGGSSYTGSVASGTTNQGNPGGPNSDGGGGGGGAGAFGQDNGTTNSGGPGGYGLRSGITGMPLFYAGGGGAGAYPSGATNWGLGGLGGGGTGRSLGAVPSWGTFGIPFTGGGGGGGGGEGGPGSSGGSGVVIVRYKNFSSTNQTYRTELVQDKLTCHLDSGNTASYAGSGSTWTDLSGYGHNATMTNVNFDSSTFGGVFNFNTSQYGTVANTAINNIGVGDYTVGIWARANTFTTDSFFRRLWTFGDSTSNDLTLHVDTSGYLVLRFNNGIILQSRWFLRQWKWYYIVVSRQRSGMRDNSPSRTVLYVDGEPWGITTTVNDLTSAAVNGLSIGRHPAGNGRWDGYIGGFHVYKYKGLNRSEISQNYRAVADRYGRFNFQVETDTSDFNLPGSE